MDSGNSGSMQSSSGGDDEYDSRAESISAFLNHPPPHHHHVPPFNQPPHTHTHVFDHLSNYFDPNTPIQRPSLPTPNPLLNLDMVWSKPGRSEPNPADLGAYMPSSSSGQNQAFLSGQTQSRGGAFHALPPESSSRGLLSVSAANDQPHPNTNSASTNSNVVRNPKKRSRASRRAPTTVLTTDTTNFRAMVQEFTGIPAPPFTSSPFPRARLDLFASAPPSLRSAHLDPPLPPYLLRPFAQKLQPPNPFLSPPTSTTSSSSSSMPSFPTTSTMVDTLVSNSSTSINYQLSSDLGLLKQSLNVNMHNPILNFQSILQPPPKYPPPNTSSPSINLAPKSQGSLEIPLGGSDSHLKVGVLEELGLNHNAHVNANVSGLHHNMVSSSSDGAMTRDNMGATNVDGDQGSFVRSLGGANYSNTERVTSNNGIVNYLASSDFHGEKGPECVTAAPRSEGMVESWINCSSD